MTHDRAVEIAGVAVTSFATVTAGAVAIDASTVLTVLFGIGVAAVSGYYAAQITTTSRLSGLEAQVAALSQTVKALSDEMHRYYEIKKQP